MPRSVDVFLPRALAQDCAACGIFCCKFASTLMTTAHDLCRGAHSSNPQLVVGNGYSHCLDFVFRALSIDLTESNPDFELIPNPAAQS